ncbi:MAG: hypothetical protein Q7K03_00930 [Dehalococcoidia bacterium]|nr:hypothetical protein [Dehalococcoidia bacterium]
MTTLLEEVFARVARLPEEEQDAIARWLMEELASEHKWESLLAGSQDKLTSLADQALSDYRQGWTSQLDPKAL